MSSSPATAAAAAAATTTSTAPTHHHGRSHPPATTTTTTSSSSSWMANSHTQGVSMSLPLLQGLCHQPQTAQLMVREALTRFVAGRKLALWIYKKKYKKSQQTTSHSNSTSSPRTKKRSRAEESTTFTTAITTKQQTSHHHHHWLLESLSSWSRVERQLAAQLLLQGACACTACTAHATKTGLQRAATSSSGSHCRNPVMDFHDSESTHWQLQWMIRTLLQQSIILESPTNVPAGVPLEWTGLLKHLVLQPIIISNTATTTITNNKFYPTDARLLAFAKRGIPWVCQSLWTLLRQLQRQPHHHSTTVSLPANLAQPILQTMLGLLDLVYFVLLVVLVEQAPNTVAADVVAAAANNNTTSTTTTTSDKTAQEHTVARRKLIRQRLGRAVLWNLEEPSATTATTNDPHAKNAKNANSTVEPLSSLACLMGVYHSLKAQSQGVGDLPTRTADACVQLLGQILDPHATVQVVPMTMASSALNKNHTTTSATATSASARTTNRPLDDRAAAASALGIRPYDAALRTAAASRRTRSARRIESDRRRQYMLGGSSNAAAASSLLLRGGGSSNMPRLLSSILSGGDPVSGAASSNNNNNPNNNNADGDAAMAQVQLDDGNDDGEDDDDRPPPLAMAHASDAEHHPGEDDDHRRHHEDSDDDDDDDDDEEEEEEDLDHDEEDEEDDDEDAMQLDDEEDDDEEHHHEPASQEDAAPEEDESIDSAEASGPHPQQDEQGVEVAAPSAPVDPPAPPAAGQNVDGDRYHVHNDDDDDSDDDDDDDDVILGEEDHDLLEEGLLDEDGEAIRLELEDMTRSDLVAGAAAAAAASGSSGTAEAKTPRSAQEQQELNDRKRAYLQACMQVLAVQHPPLLQQPGGLSLVSPTPMKVAKTASTMSPSGHHGHHHHGVVAAPILSLAAEQSLLESVLAIVRPPKKPLNTKIIMRRAPTQEEFFRGSLSRNPVSLTQLNPPNAPAEYEPTVRDLRRHIADDLQMSDSAELLELLVANKIIDVNLKLRVVHQVTWKNHLMESGASSSSALSSFLSGGAGGPGFFSSGPGLSMMFSSSSGALRGGAAALGGSRGQITADTPITALPPMVVTYRLAGVDGEATEDTVTELVDPDAPSDAMTTAEVEALMEKEFGLTRIMTEGRGSFVLLRSVENHCQDILRRIRSDDVSVQMEAIMSTSSNPPDNSALVGKNMSRNRFKTLAPFPGLILLRCCAKLPSNRKKLLQSRAPTVLLRLLLDVLNAVEDPHVKKSVLGGTSDSSGSGSNPTSDILQELIESLASDISSTSMDSDVLVAEAETGTTRDSETSSTSMDDAAAGDVQADQDATTLSLVLSSLETISLSPPLRNIIAKLLPFLTYGQADLSRELALNFDRHLDLESLVDEPSDESSLLAGLEASICSKEEKENDEDEMDVEESKDSSAKELLKSSVLMEAFVQTSITLPPSEVCHALRLELCNCGFIGRLASFISKDSPSVPPPWSAALWPSNDEAKGGSPSKQKRDDLVASWRQYFQRRGLRTAFNMLIGLCKSHFPTQNYIGNIGNDTQSEAEGDDSVGGFLQLCHWLESTSDSSSGRVYVRGLGLLAETLLDEVGTGNEAVSKKVGTLRKLTRMRKKEIAQARRAKALINMNISGFGAASPARVGADSASVAGVRGTAASLLAPVLGFFRENPSPTGASASSTARPQRSTRQNAAAEKSKPASKPAWMAELENLEEESGLVCAVCQEGKTLQPSELLGLYCYVKKVTLSADQGTRDSLDGTTLLRALPASMPDSTLGSHAAVQWFPVARSTADDLQESSHQRAAFTMSSSRRNSYFTTTVSSLNAIHKSCHARARTADRNNPKAPKQEWQGATLRNSRVNCNVILPLVSSRSSDVSLAAVDAALTEHQTAVTNLTGQTSKSMLWTVLHDVRFLTLRMAYGESLSVDCGGGSLASNTQLLLYQFQLADMFVQDAQIDSPSTANHARNLSAGYLAAVVAVHAPDFKKGSSTPLLMKGLADAAPMACLCCILFQNKLDDSAKSSNSESTGVHPNRRWVQGREQFLRGLLLCAGRRHALGLESSGCVSGRSTSSSASGLRSGRVPSFEEWDFVEDWPSPRLAAAVTSTNNSSSSRATRGGSSSSNQPSIDDFARSLRPFITLFAFLDVLSEHFVLNMSDTQVEECSTKLVDVLEKCQKSKSLRELLSIAQVTTVLDDGEMMADFQKGMLAA